MAEEGGDKTPPADGTSKDSFGAGQEPSKDPQNTLDLLQRPADIAPKYIDPGAWDAPNADVE